MFLIRLFEKEKGLRGKFISEAGKKMKFFKHSSLRKNLVVWLIFIVLISTTSSFLLYYGYSIKSLEGSVEDNLSSISKNKVRFIDFWLKEHSKIIQSFAQSQDILSANPQIIQSSIQNFNKIHNDFSAVSFINEQGISIYNSRYSSTVNVSDRDYFQAAKNKKDYISDAIISRYNESPIIVISSPVIKNGLFAGAVIGVVDLNEISSILSSSGIDDITNSFIIDRSGNIIVKSKSSNLEFKNIKDTINVSNNISIENIIGRAFKDGFIVESFDNNNILESYSMLPHKGWLLVNEIDISHNINTIKQNSLKVGLLTSLLITLLSIPFILYLSKKLSTPINNIANMVYELSAGNFEKRIDFSSHNEVGILASSFNAMAEKLQSTYTELKERIADLNSQKEEIELKNIKLEQVIEVNKTILNQLEEKNKQLEQANRLKAEFLANMTHEFRTPMNSIIGYTEMILDGNDGEINEEQKKDLVIILKSAEKLLGIINDILDLSKLEAGKMNYSIKKFNIIEEILGLIENIKGMSQTKGIDLIFEYQEGLPDIYSDPNKINHIVSNLLSNAVKFTDSGSIKVLVSLENEKNINITVSDTGIGIPEDELSSIFDEFRQLDGSSTRKYEGTGLGLTIAKGLVEGLGGTIEVTSQVGVGSTFVIKIPISKSACVIEERRAPSETMEIKLPDPDKTIILVVTRNTNNFNAINNILSIHNFKVLNTDYSNTIETARMIDPGCIFIDIDLPCTNCNDGWLALSDLKQDRSTAHIPIVVISTQKENSLSYILGATDHLVKPFNTQAILESINRCFAKQGRGYVLMVEENRESADLISKIVRKNSSYSTLIVSSRKDIFNILESSNLPKFIILNTSILDIKPIEIINMINAADPQKRIPIIAIAEKDLSNLEQEFLKQNVDKILFKSDIRHSKIVNEVKKILFEISNS